MAYLRDAGGSRRRAAVRDWLVSHYGSRTQQGTALPAELDGWLPVPRKAPIWLALFSSGLLSGAVVVSITSFGKAIFTWIGHEASGVALTLSVLAIDAALYYVGGRATYGLALSQGGIIAQVKSPARPRADAPNDVHFTLRRKLPLWFLIGANYALALAPALYVGTRRLLRWHDAYLSLERSEKYRQAARRLPRRLRTSLRITRWSLRWFRLYRRTALDLLVARQQAWQCWEAVVALNAGHVRDVSDLRLRFRRSVPGARRTVVARLDAITEIRCWTIAPAGGEIARRGWSSLIQDARFTVVSSQSVPWQVPPEQTAPAAQVLHVIGSAVETASAIRLEAAPPPDSSGSWSAESREPGEHVRGELVSSEELVSLFPGITLCILQAPPTTVDSRTSADRDQAGKLRQLAAELFKLGVPYVLTMPPLPMAIGAAVIDEMAAVLRKGHRQTVDLLDAIAAAQADLSDWSEADAETRLEAAFDICLYAPQR
jgi:hypothetical protein